MSRNPREAFSEIQGGEDELCWIGGELGRLRKDAPNQRLGSWDGAVKDIRFRSTPFSTEPRGEPQRREESPEDVVVEGCGSRCSIRPRHCAYYEKHVLECHVQRPRDARDRNCCGVLALRTWVPSLDESSTTIRISVST